MDNKDYYLVEGEFLRSLLKYFAAKGHQNTFLHIKDVLESEDFSTTMREAEMFRFVEGNMFWQKDPESQMEWWEGHFPEVFAVDDRLLDFRDYIEFIMQEKGEEEHEH